MYTLDIVFIDTYIQQDFILSKLWLLSTVLIYPVKQMVFQNHLRSQIKKFNGNERLPNKWLMSAGLLLCKPFILEIIKSRIKIIQ